MRNRKIQRWIAKNVREKHVSIRDESGALDPTAFEAVKRIVAGERRDLIGRYFRAVCHGAPLSAGDESDIRAILDKEELD